MKFPLEKLAVIIVLCLLVLSAGCAKSARKVTSDDLRKSSDNLEKSSRESIKTEDDSKKIVGEASPAFKDKTILQNVKEKSGDGLGDKLKESLKGLNELADDELKVDEASIMSTNAQEIEGGGFS